MPKKWTEEECKFLRTHFVKMDNEQLAKKFKVSRKAISSKLRALNIKREEKGVPVAKKVKRAKGRTVTRALVHQNIRCRYCLIIDGYTQKEQNCRSCGKKLFKDDVL